MPLVQLTDIDGEPCLVQTDFIVACVRDKEQGGKRRPYTAVWFGIEFSIRVQETPADIWEQVPEDQGDEIEVELVPPEADEEEGEEEAA